VFSILFVSISPRADFNSGYVSAITIKTDWFLYIGQSIWFLFILLSLLRSSDSYLRGLMRLNIVVFAFLLILLLLSPILPAIDMTTRTVLVFSRFVICMLILIAYFSTYLSKRCRFSLLMSISFFFFTANYLMSLQQYFVPIFNQYIFRDQGDISGVIGLIVLVAAVSIE